jgi:hypothetical protein
MAANETAVAYRSGRRWRMALLVMWATVTTATGIAAWWCPLELLIAAFGVFAFETYRRDEIA